MAKSKEQEKLTEMHINNLHVLKDRIKSNDLGGCYIFYGEEEYTKNHYSKLLTQASGESLNTTCFYGQDFNLPDFLSACETNAVESLDMFSMLDEEASSDDSESGFRVIKLYSPDFSEFSKSDTDYLISFLSNLPEKTIVIFWFYAGDEDSALKGIYKKISEFALTVNFKCEPVGSSVLITWILRHFSKAKLNVERHVAVHLCQTVGNSMTNLKNEIDKLIDYLRFENRDTLTKDDVDFICIKSKEAQIFDISNGAISGNFIKAARALDVLKEKREKPLLIFGTITKAVSDLCTTDAYMKKGVSIQSIAKTTNMREFIVRNSAAALNARSRDFKGQDSFPKVAAKLCLEYDKKLKSSRTDGYELLLELIFKLSYAGRV